MEQNKKFGFLPLIACLSAGIIGAIPYYCEKLFVFTFISIFAQFYLVFKIKSERRRVFLPFFCYFLGFYTPLYLFLSELYPYERFGFNEDQATFVLICSCIAIPLLHATVEALIMMVSKLFKGDAFDIIGYAALWVIGEWILTLGLLAFPWGNVAVSLTGFLPYLQTASLFGKYFITFITVAGCCALAYSAAEKKRLFALLGAGVILTNAVIGTVIWFIPAENIGTVKVAAIQGNTLSNEKWASGSREAFFERYISLTEEAASNGAKLIVLPESAIPIAFAQNGIVHDALAEVAKEYGITVIAGVHYYENGDSYNSVIAVMPDGSLSERYDKRHLVPFGEFIPFVDVLGEIIPFIAEFNAETGTYIEGDKPVVIETDYGNVAPLVCFDSIFPQFSVDGVDNGAEMLAVVTNDSWFNDSFGIYTHLRHAQLRAIENGRYILRAANTGVSAFIDEQGKILECSEPLTVDIVYSDIERIADKTLYDFIGDAVLYICFGILIFFVMHNIITRKGASKDGKNAASQDRDL